MKRFKVGEGVNSHKMGFIWLWGEGRERGKGIEGSYKYTTD